MGGCTKKELGNSEGKKKLFWISELLKGGEKWLSVLIGYLKVYCLGCKVETLVESLAALSCDYRVS